MIGDLALAAGGVLVVALAACALVRTFADWNQKPTARISCDADGFTRALAELAGIEDPDSPAKRVVADLSALAEAQNPKVVIMRPGVLR